MTTKKKIVWDKVTPLSQTIAIVLFVAVWAIGFFVGYAYRGAQSPTPAPIHEQESLNALDQIMGE